uniref:Reverse transcriptase domain-containing protein n=1 Tax=Tanacetum cinerariifolium TaxID=118510 RepID=A0A699H7F4_TANCI|nr:reverse transcriptase domain-containing protein [Tanacetum cinerariifolium]
MTANQIDVIDMDYEEYSQEVLGFFDVIASGNLTPYYDPIVSTSFLTLTAFRDSDFLLEEVDAFLALEDDPTSLKVYHSYFDPEGDIILLEAFVNDDLSLPPPNQGNHLPEVRKEFKICETKTDKSSIDEPPEVELKDLPPHIEYVFLEGDDKFPVIIAKDLSVKEKAALITGLKSHKRAMLGNSPTSRVLTWNFVLTRFSGRKTSNQQFNTREGSIQKSTMSLKRSFALVENEENDLILTRLVTGWRVYIDYQKLNEATRKGHFPLPFMDQMLERLAGNKYYCFLRCMMAIFHDMIKNTIEVFMDDFSVFGDSFKTCLSHLEKMLKRCKDTNLCLNWDKSHFMVKEGIVLGHKISKDRIKVDKAKVNVIAKLPHPTTVKDSPADDRILEKDTPFFFSKECVEAFQTLKRKLTEAPILISPDWDLPFELMCDASDFAIGVVLGQRQKKHFTPIHYARKTMTKAESNYTTTEKEVLAVVYAFEKFRCYVILNKSIVYTDHSALKYLFAKKDSKAILLRWVLLL